MFDVFFSHVLKKVSLTEEEKSVLKSFFVAKNLQKKEFLLQEGEVCKYLSFVSKGLLRSYHIDEKGDEHMNLFAWEGWWTSDIYSFSFNETAQFNIDALEDSELLLITRENLDEMTLQIPKMDRYFRILFQNSLATKERRLVSSNSYTAKEKYIQLAESNPQMIQRVPQNLIASYLGLAPETLSRIKKNIALGK
ncbi:cAMP-binding domain of CRP or a regulatory subunit of cAMP-dependent protein kinases [Flavobacterium aquidurense]|uniref:Cyclic nucleotide-binding protein n=1 Tax=Flavobacterium frigidimaris TaxID=262320 RepID=A0ABX4BTV0_FLAFR|nr:Crp/Fnr family transcriptional regulator [Flavobacterium frigidimaris]OXA80945.1 cyclic nucleotide-binding protein [Flavobacterium frigidimaris]SDY48801.1 cAMP-binding domain of CRP or a regulatory subunit of cAMP-dependent protein kinases [Flavobacterium aquidurense]